MWADYQRRNRIQRRIFGDRSNPLEIYADAELFEQFWLCWNHFFEIVDMLRADIQHDYRQKGSLSAEMQVRKK